VTRFIERMFASREARGGLVVLLAGAVLLPTLSLSVLSVRFITRPAEAERANLLHEADGLRWYLEQQLDQAMRLKALEAARVVGATALAAEDPEQLRRQLARFHVDAFFETLHLDVASPLSRRDGDDRVLQVEREAIASQGPEPFLGASGEEALPLLDGRGEPLGLLRFRYTRAGQAAVVREWFENDFSAPWDDDSVELFFDGTPGSRSAYDSFTRQFIVRIDDPDLWEQHSRTLGVAHAWARVADGYSVELAVPWTHLGVRPEPGRVIGFDVSNNNDDDGGEREGQLAWAGSVENWTDKSGFGRVLLAGNRDPGPPAGPSPLVVAWPAPATMTVDGRLDEPAWHLDTALTKVTSGVNRNRVRFGLLWDASFLYVGVHVQDAHLVNDHSTHNNRWAVRVTDAAGDVLYESEPTPDGRFDVAHKLTHVLRGGTLLMRPHDPAVEREARRFQLRAIALVALIDLVGLAGLVLVYVTVRRQVHLARLKSEFVANVSHELKTPVALIHLFAETLEAGRCSSEEKRHHYYKVMNTESRRLTALIDNMLDFARIEAGRKEYRFGPVALAPILREVVEIYRGEFDAQGFTLEVDVDEDVPPVRGDAEAVRQSVLNLVGNAVKYSRERKYVRLALTADDDGAHVVVEDHGIGIAASEQTKIFDKFYRAEDSLVHETKGSGLGLSLVREIVKAHGGRVTVASTPGRGTAFTLVLPFTEDSDAPITDRRGRAEHGDGASGQLRA
jgi:signal transduction histidine kinase